MTKPALIGSISASARSRPAATAGAAPALLSKAINSAGTTLTLTFDIAVSVGAGGSGGATLTPSGAAATLTYASGSGTTAIAFTISRAIQSSETATCSYTQPGNGFEATVGGTDVATFGGSSVTNGSTQGTTFETTFNGLSGYTSWTPTTGTTAQSRPAQSKPTTKSSSLSDVKYTDTRFGTAIFYATKVTDYSVSVAHMRNDYSKRQMWNADETRFISVATDSSWHLYNASTFAKLDGGRTGSWPTALPGIIGSDCEPIWHPTNPNKLWYTADFGGLTWYELDITTGVSTTLFSFTGRLSAVGLGSGTRTSFGGEGRPSNDGRYWCFMVTSGDGSTGVGLMTYDRQTDTIIATVATTNRPNWTGMSQDGNYAIVAWSNGTSVALATQAAKSMNNTSLDGTRACARDFSTWTQLDNNNQHGDLCVDTGGNQVYVTNCYSSTMDVADGSVYYKRLDTGASVILLASLYSGLDWAMHFSGANFSRPGWCVMSYEAEQGSGSSWKDGTIQLQELKASGAKCIRIAHHQSTAYTYFASPLAAPNRGLTRVLFGSDYRSGTTPHENMMIGLPSDWDTR